MTDVPVQDTIDVSAYRGAMGLGAWLNAAFYAMGGRMTWLTEDGTRVAAIVPPEVADAWLEAVRDQAEAEHAIAIIAEMGRRFRREGVPVQDDWYAHRELGPE